MVVRGCDQFLLKGCLLLKETEFLLCIFFWLMTVKEMHALHILFLEISFSLIVKPAVLDV